MKSERQDERVASAKKRFGKAKAHEEQFNVLSKALEPLAKARQKAERQGEGDIARGIEEASAYGSGLTHNRLNRLQMAQNHAARMEAKEGKRSNSKPFPGGRPAGVGLGAAARMQTMPVAPKPPGFGTIFNELACWR